MTPPLVYLAGPYSARDRTGVEANIARAVDWGVRVAELGACPVIPHANTADARFEAAQPYPFWIAATLSLLRVCHAVLLIPGWENSGGARGERDEALRKLIPIFTTDELQKLARWIGPRGGE